MASQDDYSDIPREVPASADTEKDPENVVRGHKATLNNPQVSNEAKEHSRQVLNDIGEPYDQSGGGQTTKNDGQKDPGNVARGLKASINNPGVSDEAKERAQEKLDQLS
ncbi:conidiation protein [Colletotrichum truncatum]|uniref:Conidiation protein n=1 Tax=Colletotrichum truncatum TaxID=5467 RepID=A0ACC3Z3B5_COLTU|nr:conidiation protein [Colletotrichum truncatum]KAF6793112.1 conidiation protein [Colletotrichum truncatum]